MLAKLSPENPLQASAVKGSLKTETGKNYGSKKHSGFVTAVLSPFFIPKGGWRACGESIP